jgi:hypothetical protein
VSSMPPHKSHKKLFALLLVILRVFLWTLLLVMSSLFPRAGGLTKSLYSLIHLLLENLDKD